jgi:hypothetical protein
MAHYNNTRKEREILTDMELSHLDYLNKRQKEFENGFVPEIMDTRTKYEKLQNKDYIIQQLRKMAYNLFDNDPKYSESFINYFQLQNINYSKFSTIYDDLVKRFKGTDAQPSFVIQTAKQMINNITTTGSTQSFSDKTILDKLKELKDDIVDYNFNNNFLEQEAKEKLQAMLYLHRNIFSKNSNITINTTNQLTLKQFKDIRTALSTSLNNLINGLLRDDMTDFEKQEHIMELLNNIKGESIRKITKLIDNGDIIIKS